MDTSHRRARSSLLVLAIAAASAALSWWLVPPVDEWQTQIRVTTAEGGSSRLPPLDLPPLDLDVATGDAVSGQAALVAAQAGGELHRGPSLRRAGDADVIVVVTSDLESARAVVALIDAVLDASAPEALVATRPTFSAERRWAPSIAVAVSTAIFAAAAALFATSVVRSRRASLQRARARGAVVNRTTVVPRAAVISTPPPAGVRRRTGVPRFRVLSSSSETSPPHE